MKTVKTPNKNAPVNASLNALVNKTTRHSCEGRNLLDETLNNLITDNLDTWTTAIKSKSRTGRGSNKTYELCGIKKLRALILDLAVRGLLVPQDPNDEPASELLKKIAVEKEQLLKEVKIKKQKALPEISDEEIPFKTPKMWKFCRFGDVTFNRDGERKPVSLSNRKNMQGQFDYYGASGVIDKVNDYLFDKSLLLIGEDGANLISRRTPIAFIAHGKYWVNNHAHVIDGISLDYLQYVALFINAITLEPYITGTAQPKMNQTKMNSIVIAIPPEKEQKRIVAKVDKLMALCDNLEQQTDTSIKAHKLLVENLLNALTQAKDHKTFHEAWQRIAQHFDTLFTTEHSIDQLKQTILQLAVMGKLVPQNPNDEPASELLKKIAKEKEKLIKAGKIKKQKPLPEISEEEKPFVLPEGWKWEKIANFSNVGTGSTPSRTNPNYYSPSEYNWVTSGETSADFIYDTKEKVSTKAINETNVSIYPIGTLIVAMYGQGKTRGQISELMVDAGTNQACAAIRLIEQSSEHRQYIKLFFKKAYKEIRLHSAGGAQPNLNVGKISKTFIPLPPLKEQKHIVKKVTQLLKLCDTLKQNLKTQQTTTNRLADTIGRSFNG